MKFNRFKFAPATSRPASEQYQETSLHSFSGWTIPAPQLWKVLQSPQQGFCFFLDSVWYVPMSQVLGSPDLDPVFQMCLSRAEKKGRIPQPAGTFYLLRPRILMIICGMRVHFWLIISLVNPRTPRFFSAELISGQTALWPYCFMGLSSIRYRTLHFPLLSFMSLLSVHFSCWGPSGWQHSPLVYQQCPPVLLFPLLFLYYLWLSL